MPAASCRVLSQLFSPPWGSNDIGPSCASSTTDTALPLAVCSDWHDLGRVSSGPAATQARVMRPASSSRRATLRLHFSAPTAWAVAATPLVRQMGRRPSAPGTFRRRGRWQRPTHSQQEAHRLAQRREPSPAAPRTLRRRVRRPRQQRKLARQLHEGHQQRQRTTPECHRRCCQVPGCRPNSAQSLHSAACRTEHACRAASAAGARIPLQHVQQQLPRLCSGQRRWRLTAAAAR